MTEAEKARLRAELRRRKAQGQADPQNPDGTYGQPPAGMVLNPSTGAMTERSLLSSAYAQNNHISNTESLLSGTSRGGTFGFNDEIQGAMRSVLPGQGTMGDRYAFGRESARAMEDAQREANPNFFTGGEIGGGIATSAALGYGPIANQSNWFARSLAGLGIGAGEGFAYGFGTGEGGADQRLEKGKRDARTGAIVGGALPIASSVLTSGVKKVAAPIGGALNIGNKSRAAGSVSRAVRSSGRNIDDIAAYLRGAQADGQGVATIADALGEEGRRTLAGAVRQPGPARNIGNEFLLNRQIGQADRMAGFLDDAFDGAGTTAEKTRDLIKGNRRTVANTLFDKAAEDAAPVDVRGAIGILDETIDKMTNSGIRPPKVVRAYEKLRRQLAGVTPDGNPTTLSDYESVLGIWREVRDEVDKAYKAGDGAVGEALKPVRDALQKSLEESSDLYRFATDNYRAGSQVLDAIDTGAEMAKRGRPEDTIPAFNAMTGQQQRAARIGYGDVLRDEILRNKAEAPNFVRGLQSGKRQAESAVVANNPDLLARRAAREGDMFDTFKAATSGRSSPTAELAADQANINADDIGIITNLLSGRPVAAAGQAAGRFANAASGNNEATREIIARMLLSGDPNTVRQLETIMRRADTNAATRNLIESMIRGAGRTGGAIAYSGR